ncbi:hypothetical protein ERJ75_001705100 [Trypanosoma vivax]|nr:hypothetical protein ERJ75_001705100 [Trypanosoma vivax]
MARCRFAHTAVDHVNASLARSAFAARRKSTRHSAVGSTATPGARGRRVWREKGAAAICTRLGRGPRHAADTRGKALRAHGQRRDPRPEDSDVHSQRVETACATHPNTPEALCFSAWRLFEEARVNARTNNRQNTGRRSGAFARRRFDGTQDERKHGAVPHRLCRRRRKAGQEAHLRSAKWKEGDKGAREE